MADLVMGAMGSIIPKLNQLLKEESLNKGVKKRISSLTEELEAAEAALRMVAQVPWDQLEKHVQIWARQLREASYDMEDILDTFLVRVQGLDSSEQETFIKSLKKLLTHLQDVTEKYRWYKVEDIGPRTATASTIDPRLDAMYAQVNKLVGMDKSSAELMYMLGLQGGDVSSSKMKTVSIVGVGGLGKTTLAKVVYDKIRVHFDCTSFVPVGRNPDLKKVLKDILINLDRQRYMYVSIVVLDERQLIDELREFLAHKRYFIVIDDIWDKWSWDIIKLAIAIENNCGGRIIITTRNFEVARNAGEIYELQPLPSDISRKLFDARICGDDGIYEADKLDEIRDKILRKTGGIPLAIITMASLLVGKPMNQWSELYESIGFSYKANEQDENTMRILSMSYYDLPSHLRACFLYLVGFPENYVVKKDNLIWKWIAEGFVHERDEVRLFEVGEGYFNDLINRSMIQPVMIEGSLCGCRILYSVLRFIRSLSEEENFVHVFEEEGLGQAMKLRNVRRLAFLNRNEEHSWDKTYLLPRLRSLTAIECRAYKIPPVSSFNFLRVLDLESCGSLEGHVLEHLGNLLHLRFMGLRNTFVRKLPQEIGNLKFLQTLELEGSGVEELPASMVKLARLMCLSADWTTRVPDWIGKLTSLQQLVVYPGGGNDELSVRLFFTGLGNLRELRVLRCLIIKADDEGQLSYLLNSLFNLPKVEVIQFDFGDVQFERGFKFEPESFALPGELRFLELRGLEFPRLPKWIIVGRLPNLCHLWLMLFDLDKDDMYTLGCFPELHHLHLLIVNTQHGDANITCASGAFRNLKFCSINKPLKFKIGAMPNLEVLDFHLNVPLQNGADGDLDVDFGLENLHSLQQVIVQINCLGALPEKVQAAEAALRHAINVHPKHPILDFRLPRQKFEKGDNNGANNMANSAKGKGVEVASDGIDEPIDDLIKRLSVMDNEAYDRNIKIVPIVRSEGLAKYTLAKKVFDKITPQFDCGAFVLLGQNPDMRKVFTDILISLDKQKYRDFPLTTLDIMELIWFVRKSHINIRFFVVVDDIWDFKAWDIIKSALIQNCNASAVLTTTSRQNFRAIEDSTTADYKGFFYRKLFGSEDKCPRGLKDICEKLIVTFGGIPSFVDETVELLLGSVPITLKDLQAVYYRRKLALSYPKLPDHLQKCLQYFSMFRQGYEISAERLVLAWIAQGLVQGTSDQTSHEVGRRTSDLTSQEVGRRYLSDLIKEDMIEAVEVDAAGKALSCRMHDLVHDTIVSKATEENFVAILDDSQKDRALPVKVQWLSIQGKNIVHSPPKAWLQQVQSLVSCDTVQFFSDFQGLHAMDLGGCELLQASHLKDIKKIIPLRYLVIGGKNIADIPKEIGKLENLRTLDLSASGLSELPKCVLSLRGLECLFVSSHMKIPDGIEKMSALQELGDINIVNPKLLKRLRKLQNLRVLRIAIWSWDEGSNNSVKKWWDTLLSEVSSWKKIDSLCILTFCTLDFMDGSVDKWPSQTLKKLEIKHSAFNNNTLPRWFESLSNISSLTIGVNKLSQDITDTLGELSTLSSLSLTSKQVPEPGVRFVIDSADRFKELESLKFVSNEMVKLLERPESNAKHKFTRLTIVFHASKTAHSRNKDFRFGLDKLLSLQHARVEINCSNATKQMINDAEGAIQEEISKLYRNDRSQPYLEIRRLQEESMIEEEEQTTCPQIALTSFSCNMETVPAQPIAQSIMLLPQNSSNDTFFKNVGILTSSTKIKTLKERALEELTAEKQGSTALHQEVDALKIEFEEFKKKLEENNQLLKQIFHSNNADTC